MPLPTVLTMSLPIVASHNTTPYDGQLGLLMLFNPGNTAINRASYLTKIDRGNGTNKTSFIATINEIRKKGHIKLTIRL